jgi:hypothetical protein
MNVPFSVIFTRMTPANVTRNAAGFINVGPNFPATATIAALLPEISSRYSPSTRTLFSGTVDDREFTVQYLDAFIFANLPIPELSSVWLALHGMAVLGIFSRQNRIRSVGR